MVRSRVTRRFLLPLFLAAAVVRCGGGDQLTLPSEGLPTAITALEGDGQHGTVGLRLTDTLVVRVTDARDRPVQSQPVVFQAIAGGAAADLIPDTAITDADGRARSVWVLGTIAGQQRVEARVVQAAGATTLKTTFTATAAPAAADTILAVKGDNQSGTVGTVLTDSLAVLVTDQYGNPIAGRTVTWAVPTGQGTVSAATTTTGADGRAAVARRLGPTAGAQGATASSTGLKGSPVSFTHTATAGGATKLVKVHGDGQTAPAGFQVTDSLVVEAQDANGNGVPGLNVIWVVATGGGSVSALSSVTDAQGRAFTFWSLGPQAGPNTLTAAVTGLQQVTFAATGTSAQPARIQAQSATAQNGTAGQPVAAPPSVKVTDQNNNPVAGVTVTFLVTQGGGTVSDGTGSGASASIATGANGVATLTSWTLGTTAGANTLTATAAGNGITGNPVSFAATAGAGAAARVTIVTEPSATAQVGVPLATQPIAQLVDAFGNPVAQSGRTVTVSVLGGGAALRGTAQKATDGAGLAQFTGLDLVGPVGSYALIVSATNLASDTSVTIALSAGAAHHLGLATPPGSNAASGVPLQPQPAVQVQDLADNPVAQAGLTVTAAIASGGGTLGGTTSQVTGANGLATFTDLSISGTAGARTLSFSAPGLTGVTSGPVTIGAGSPTQLALAIPPSTTAQSGVVLATQPVVELRDASGNPVAQAGITVTVAVSQGATLGGATTAQTNAQGQAAFTGLSLTGPAGTYTLSFSAPNLTAVSSAPIALSAGLGAKLALITQPPANAQSGVVLAPAPVVQLLDQANNPVAQAGLAVAATIATGAGGSLGGTDTVLTDAQGKATFSNLILSGPVGTYSLAFGGTGLGGVTSNDIALAAGPAARLAVVTQPPITAQSGVALTTAPVVRLEDGAGNPVASAGVNVTVAIASGGGTLSGSTTVATDAQGQAAFPGLAISGTVGNRTLSFSSQNLTPVTSAAILLGAGPAANLAIQAGNNQAAAAGSALPVSPAVTVTDQSGNPVAGVTVNFEVTAGGGSIGSPTVLTDAQGIATEGWTLGTVAGANTMIAFATLQGGADTVTFTATGTPGSAGQLGIMTQPPTTSASGAVFATAPEVQLQDVNGNPLTTNGVAIRVTASGGTLGGNRTVATTGGIATFPGLSLTGLTGSYTLTFSVLSGNVTGVTSDPITLTAGAANRLAVVTQPGNAQSGIVLPQQPVLQVQDAAGNPVPSVRNVTAAVNSGPGGVIDPNGRSVTTDAAGVASFSALRLTGPAGTYSLIFTSAGILSDTSASFLLSAGAPAQVSANTPTSQSAPAGSAVASPPAVLVRDGAGNPVAGVSVTFQVTAGGGSLNGGSQVTDAAGIASVTGWTLGPAAGPNTVTATVAGSGISGNPVTFTATGTAGTAASITATQGNGQTATVGTAVATVPTVRVSDANNNPVSGVNVTFTTSGGATLPGGGTTVVVATNASGLAASGAWTLGTAAGGYTLTADVPGLPGSPVSFTATATAGAAATITKQAGDQQTAAAGSTLPVAPSVLVQDQFGNPVSGALVTFQVTGGGGTVVPVTAVLTDGQGIATAQSWTLGPGTGANAVTATVSGGPSTVFSATAIAGAAARLVLATAPSSSAQSGVALATQPVVQVADASGNAVAQAGVTVTAVIATGSGTLSNFTAVSDPSGVAAFAGLTITGQAGSYTLRFDATPLTSVTSGTIAVGAGSATQLVITQQPPAAAASGVAFTTQPTVRLQDGTGNPVLQAGVTVTASVASGSGNSALTNASAITNASGIATFSGLALAGPTGTYTLQFSATGLTAAVSNTVTLGAGPARQVTLTVQPPPAAASGQVFAQSPVVQVRDSAGNAAPAANLTIVASIASGPAGATLSGTTSAVTNASGTATFGNLQLTGPAGDYTLRFSSASLGASVVSSTVTLGAGTAAKLAILTPPSSSVVNGVAFAQQPVIQLQDASGNPTPVAGVVVQVQVLTGSAVLGGTTSVQTDASGQAAFTNLRLTGPVGDNTLNFSAPSSVAVSSGTITVTPGAPARLAIVTQPPAVARSGIMLVPQPVVELRDQSDNVVTQAGAPVTAAIASGGGTLQGTAIINTGSNGRAVFQDLAIGGTLGNRTLGFSSTGLTGVTSNTINLGAGPAARMSKQGGDNQNATVGTAVTVPPAVLVTDQFGNPVPDETVTFTVTGGGGSVTGGTAITDAAGIATVGSWMLGTTAGTNNNTLQAAHGTAGSVSFTATAIAATATHLTITTQPSSSVQNGVALATQPVLQLRDAFGNAVPQAGASVTASIATGGGTLSGTTTTSTNASGVATFSGLTITGLVGTRTLAFNATGLTGATSGPIDVTTGSATTIAGVSAASQAATVGTAVAAPPSVRVTDIGGNPVQGVAVSFAVTGGGGSLTGGNATTNASGIATVGSWTLGTTAGANSLTATSGGLSGSPVTFTATGTVGAPTQITVSAGQGQSATVNTAVNVAPAVRVTDQHGNPVQGETVTFTLTGGGGSVTGGTAITDAAGIATVGSWTLGTTAGTGNNTLEAAHATAGSVNFTASATAGAATGLTITSVNPQSAVVGGAVGSPPQVRAHDQFNNPVPGVAVTFAVASGGGTVVPTTAITTGANGLATATSWTLGAVAGANTLNASAPGLPTVQFTATGVAGSATKLAFTTSPSAAVQSGVPFATQPAVQLQDANGNPVAQSGIAITATITAGTGGTLTNAAATTNGAGLATFTGLTLSGPAGGFTLSFGSGSLTPVTAAVALSAGTATTIVAASATSQAGTVGTAVAAPPSVLVTDNGGNPVPGVAVTFAVTGGGGSLTGGNATTNASGIATVGSWTLGTTAGPNALQATATGLTGSPVSFTATGAAGAATQISVSAGNNQNATVGTAVTVPPAVHVSDQFGNPVQGETVTFTVTGGGGSVTGGTAVTAASGIATVGSWTLGTTAGTNNNTLEAAHATAGTANFTASATAGAATGLTITSANPQSAVVGTAVGAPPQVLAHDQFNNPVQGVAVTYVVTAGGGTVVPTTAITTGANGLATATSWTLGPVAGANTLEARATGLTTVQFSATGLAGSAAKLAFVAAPSSTAQSGVAFAAQPVIQLQDASGNPVAQVGVVISATIAAGTGGSLTNASATTNASGVATFTGLTLSGPAGGFTLSFGSAGLTAVTAGVTLSAGPAASIAAASATSQQATVGTAVAAPPSVLVTDNGGNPVPGVAVTFAVTGGGGSVTGGNATTNASGIATVGSWTLGTTAGPNTLTATSGGLSGSPVTFTANGTTGAPTQISVSTGNNQSATVNTAVTVPPAVLVTDQFGNPVPGETVTFTVTSGGGSVTGGTAITDAAGIATVGSWTLGTTAGTDNNTLEAAHATAGNVNFTASAAAGPAAALAFTVQPSATLAGQVITPAIQVAVRDAFGNLVTTASNSITLSLSTDPNGGTNLSGTLTKAAVGGIATFDDLSLDLSGVGFELEASSGGLPPATSAPFDIN